MNDHDNRNESAEHGDGERVVVRDRRRIDPVTGEVRAPVGEPAGDAPEAGEPEQPVGPDAVASAELAAQVAERTADLQRVSAEYANYRRRVDRDRESVLVGARVQFVSELLTVLDDLDRAESHGDLTGAFKSVGDKLVAVVQKLGLEPFGSVGELFDPSVHEAVQHEAGTDEGPTVTVVSAVLRRGYRIADRVLRPAMVTVVDRADDGTLTEPAQDPVSPEPDPAVEP
ncbi:nucleotide exchange factor GrpE [Pseudonocardia sp. MH-G8]|uniref:nucleotide exchange factor GrpE n=1 Tax=Pseudonocardia sp. MH-G8 TaxID=1854588 RepID=UPI000BA0AF59|nr:nucleotide exchange factor GrpE [Pseudonocardia sp. MH-G8]OZM82856.1 nucleotide exchange factor GrpE [Pseudonocardia sp. MH-G8]